MDPRSNEVRIMVTETKRPTIMVGTSDTNQNALVFDVDGVGKMVFDAANTAEDIRHRAMMHGFEQKIRDAAAIAYKQGDGTFKRPTAKQKYDAMRDVIETLNNGDWNKKREGGGDVGLLLEALIRLYPKRTPDDLRVWLAGKDDKAKATLRRLDRIATLMAEIRAERNPDAVTAAEDILTDLNDDE
jgi:hypothetical protein